MTIWQLGDPLICKPQKLMQGLEAMTTCLQLLTYISREALALDGCLLYKGNNVSREELTQELRAGM